MGKKFANMTGQGRLVKSGSSRSNHKYGSFCGIKWAAAMMLNHAVTYYGARCMTAERSHFQMGFAVERGIPFIPWTIILYLGAYIFWAVSFYIILRGEEETARKFAVTEIAGTLACSLLFLAIPTTMERPSVDGHGLCANLIRLLYRIDAPDNLFPSIHCYLSVLCYLGIKRKKGVPAWFKNASLAMAVLICISTLTVKQHVAVDVAAGISVACLVDGIGVYLLNREILHWKFPDDLLCYLSGLTKLSFKKFVWIIILGKPWCILAYCLGFSLFS